MKRRNFMKSLGMVGLSGLAPLRNLNAKNMNTINLPGSTPSFDFFKKESNEFKFLVVLGKAHYKFADIGELLAIKNAVNEDDASSFVSVYTSLRINAKPPQMTVYRKAILLVPVRLINVQALITLRLWII